MSLAYPALQSELQTDPTTRGYAAPLAAGAYSTVVNLLNAPNGSTVFRGVIDSHEIVGATDPAEWAALSAAEKQRYQTITGTGKVDTANANIRNAFLAMFAGGTATRAALIALASRPSSRAETLFGAGTVISAADVAIAIRGSI